VKRSGGWILGLIVVAAMIGGGWFASRRLWKHPVTIVLLRSGNGRGPTDDAIERGSRFALQEWGHRAGRYRVDLQVSGPDNLAASTVWLGTSEALLLLGDHQPAGLSISVLDTHPIEPGGCFRISPGCARQGASAAAWARRSKAARIFLLRDKPSLRSEAVASAFESEARALGLSVEGPADTSADPVDRILASGSDLVFYSGEEAPYGTSHKIFSALRRKGFTGRLAMGEADPEVSFLATRPDLVDGTYLVSPFAPAPAELATAMGTTPGPHVTAGYYAMKAALEAIDRADSMHPGPLKEAAARLRYFDAQGRAALRKCALYVARGGKFEFVELLE